MSIVEDLLMLLEAAELAHSTVLHPVSFFWSDNREIRVRRIITYHGFILFHIDALLFVS